MKKIFMQASYILLISSILFISCKKDQQAGRLPTQQPSNVKLDTTFQFTIKQLSPFDIVNWFQKDFYIPILDSVANPDLKVDRILITTASTDWQEVYLDSARIPGPHYVRSKGYVTYSEQIRASSAKITVRILGKW